MKSFYNRIKALAAILAFTGVFTAGAQGQSLEVNVSDVSITDAKFTITPSDNDLKYYWMYDTKANFEANGGSEGIINKQINNWQNMASYYPGKTWQEIMTSSLYSGVTETSGKEQSSSGLVWDTDYVLYAFGMDTEGNVSAPLQVAEFKTLPRNVSENTFNVKVKSMEIDSKEGATRTTVKTTISITPSNNDPYIVYVLEKRYVDRYDLTPGSEGETQFLINQVLRYAKDTYTGPQTITQAGQRVGTEFCIVTVGKDEAPTTAVNILEYTAEEKAPEPEPSLEVNVSDVSIADAKFTITPSDNDLKYYWMYDTKANFEANGGSEGIINKQINNWQNMASYYPGKTWQEIMTSSLYSGVIETSGKEQSSSGLVWDTDYVLYAFGMDAEGNVSAPLQVAEFKTLPRKVSENTFNVKIESMEIDSKEGATRTTVKTTYTVTPTNDDPYLVYVLEKRYVDRYDLTPGSEGETEFLINQVLRYAKDTYTGPQTFTQTGQRVGTEFCIVTVGMDEAPTTAVNILEYTAEEKVPEPEQPFIIEISDVSQSNAYIKVVPPNNEMKYYLYMATPENIESHGGREVVDIELDRGWYQFLESLYGNITWQELMSKDLITGVREGYVAELDDTYPPIKWDSEYVLYVYGVDENCIRNTEIYFADIHTTKCNTSDLTFEFQLVSIEKTPTSSGVERYKATIDVYPSNDEEQYAVHYHKTSIYDQYETNDEWSIDDYIFDQFKPYCTKFTGAKRLVVNEIRNDTDYYIIAIGWDEAPTTEVYKFRFNYLSEPLGVADIEAEAVKVMAIDGGITIKGNYEQAAVYNIDGKVMGALRGDGAHVSLPAGLYIVKYKSNEETTATKVIVK